MVVDMFPTTGEIDKFPTTCVRSELPVCPGKAKSELPCECMVLKKINN